MNLNDGTTLIFRKMTKWKANLEEQFGTNVFGVFVKTTELQYYERICVKYSSSEATELAQETAEINVYPDLFIATDQSTAASVHTSPTVKIKKRRLMPMR